MVGEGGCRLPVRARQRAPLSGLHLERSVALRRGAWPSVSLERSVALRSGAWPSVSLERSVALRQSGAERGPPSVWSGAWPCVILSARSHAATATSPPPIALTPATTPPPMPLTPNTTPPHLSSTLAWCCMFRSNPCHRGNRSDRGRSLGDSYMRHERLLPPPDTIPNSKSVHGAVVPLVQPGPLGACGAAREAWCCPLPSGKPKPATRILRVSDPLREGHCVKTLLSPACGNVSKKVDFGVEITSVSTARLLSSAQKVSRSPPGSGGWSRDEKGEICAFKIHGQEAPFEAVVLNRTSGEGVLRARSPIDCELQKEYTFIIQAYDCGAAPTGTGWKKSHKAVVHIQVDDVNEFAPVFREPVYHATLTEGKIYDSILQVEAWDQDCSPQYSQICNYEIVTPHTPFAIDRNGNIRNTERLSYDNQQHYKIMVAAFDCGQKRAAESVPVHIEVKPVCKPGWQVLQKSAVPPCHSAVFVFVFVFVFVSRCVVVLCVVLHCALTGQETQENEHKWCGPAPAALLVSEVNTPPIQCASSVERGGLAGSAGEAEERIRKELEESDEPSVPITSSIDTET
ncbi:hypothetical protein ACEWY4_006124 [Coilia grayii]|uniref:Cadherin domain-containing protein n=1 Tax=Coilia grayii TaxID=363190 RepID=A0ABD1KCS0_9TELE